MITLESADVAKSAVRIASDLATLAGPDYTSTEGSTTRYGFTREYCNAVAFLRERADSLGMTSYADLAGNLVCSNVGADEWAFGIGSHCDSVRDGGQYDGTLGMLVAMECARLNEEHCWGLPLRIISFAEEEGSGFGRMLLGSSVATGAVTEEDLADRIHSIDDGRSFLEHRTKAGEDYPVLREGPILNRLTAWVEVHIEQGSVLERNQVRLGVVPQIAGWIQTRVTLTGQAAHAGGTPMDARRDAGVLAARLVLRVEESARSARCPTVGTVGSLMLRPGQTNVIPGRADLSVDIRGVCDNCVRQTSEDVMKAVQELADARAMNVEEHARVVQPTTTLDERVIGHLEEACVDLRQDSMRVDSGAAHDTMLVADRVPSGMVFVPCKDGVSHSPAEEAEPGDAALAAYVVCQALLSIQADAALQPREGN